MPELLEAYPVVIPVGFKPIEICKRAGKVCPGQDAPLYKPRWGGGFHAPRGPQKTPHRAVDIMAAIGAHVVAVAPGVVQERWRYKGQVRPGSGESTKGGFYVRVLHDWGVTYYAHLFEAPYVSPGQAIEAGQILGIVGRSGNAKPGCPHLHFSMQVGKSLVDPMPYLLPLFQEGLWKETEL